MFEARVDPSPKARIDNETLDLIKRDHMTFADKLEYEGYDIECIAREIESEYGKHVQYNTDAAWGWRKKVI